MQWAANSVPSKAKTRLVQGIVIRRLRRDLQIKASLNQRQQGKPIEESLGRPVSSRDTVLPAVVTETDSDPKIIGFGPAAFSKPKPRLRRSLAFGLIPRTVQLNSKLRFSVAVETSGIASSLNFNIQKKPGEMPDNGHSHNLQSPLKGFRRE